MNFFIGHKKIFFLIIIIIIALFSAYYLFLMDIKNKEENISEMQNGLSSTVKSEELYTSMQTAVLNSSDQILEVNNSIVPSDGDVTFIEGLETMARNNGLKIGIDSLTFQEDPLLSSSSLTFFNIKGTTNGNWAGTYLFLAELESFPYKVKINRFSFSNISEQQNGTKAPTTNSWDSNFDISVLKFK